MTLPLTRRRFDAIASHLYALGVLDGEDLVMLHQLPWAARVDYLAARAQDAIDRAEQEHVPGREHAPVRRVGGHTWL